jgi:hypothetical protein
MPKQRYLPVKRSKKSIERYQHVDLSREESRFK